MLKQDRNENSFIHKQTRLTRKKSREREREKNIYSFQEEEEEKIEQRHKKEERFLTGFLPTYTKGNEIRSGERGKKMEKNDRNKLKKFLKNDGDGDYMKL